MTGAVLDAVTSLEDFRVDVRRWCVEHVPKDWAARQTGIGHDEFLTFQRSWFQELRTGGYATPHWPLEHGGGYSLGEQMVIFEELARARAPRLVLQFVSIHHAASTLLEAGNLAQKKHLDSILNGEVWCQGFSEPNAGSDLASVQTRALRDRDHYVVNGQKVWASLAMYADYCLLLARTDTDVPKRKGLSYFLMDMRSPGVEVRPIRQATGDAHFAEIFLTDVRIPAANMVGAENDGWRVAQSTLGSERGLTIVELGERLAVGFEWLVELAASSRLSTGEVALNASDVREQLATLATELRVLRRFGRRLVENIEVREAPGPEASVMKLFYSELLQRVMRLGVQIGGLEVHRTLEKPMSAGWESGAWMLDFIGSFEWTIPGGTSEIQRTIIGERMLGLPRDPGMS